MGVLDEFLTPATLATIEAQAPPAPATKRVIYVGPFAGRAPVGDPGEEDFDPGQPAGVDIVDGAFSAHAFPGEPLEVPAEVAGRAPAGTPGEEGYDPGAGLLAQVENFVEADTAATTIAEVLAEVGDDPSKAAAALAAERARDDGGRKTLIAKLEAVAGQTGDRTDG